MPRTAVPRPLVFPEDLDAPIIESDGQPVGETELHGMQVHYLFGAIGNWLRDDPTVHMAFNVFFYYKTQGIRRCVCPDLFVARGLDEPERPRRTFNLWEERKAPDLFIEVSSRGTWEEDVYRKRGIYQDVFKAREYLIFDPEADVLPEGLRAYRLVDGRYQRAQGTSFESAVVGATFRVVDGWLRLVDPQGTIVPGDPVAGRKQGREEGRELGLREALTSLLQHAFGDVQPPWRERVAKLSGAALEGALPRVLKARSVEELPVELAA